MAEAKLIDEHFDKLVIRTQSRDDYFRGVSLGIWGLDEKNRQYYAVKNIQLEPIKEGEIIPEAMALSDEQARELMDSLWLSGVRPSEDLMRKVNRSEIIDHLEDMRTIAFSKLRIDKP